MLAQLRERLQDWTRRKINSYRHGVPFTLSRNVEVPEKVELLDKEVGIEAPNERGVKADYVGIFLDDCYGLYSMDLPSSPTILDIGANVGLFGLAARQVYPNATVHSYEPAPELEQFLSHHSEEAGFTYHMEAVGPEEGTVSLARPGDSNLTRVEGSGGEIPMISFSQAIERIGQSVDLLKLDCEGCEWELLDVEKPWPQVNRIAMEYHLWAAEDLSHSDTRLKLQGLGFEVVRHPDNPDADFALLWAT